VIGGGLTGCATAYGLAASGADVVLVESSVIGRGSTASAAGWIADDPGVGFIGIEKALGRRAARHVFKAWHRAALDFGALIRRLHLKCDFEPRGSLLVATSAAQEAALKREQKGRREAGLEASLVNARIIAGETAAPGAAALRSHDGATLDPFRAALGLARAAAERGALVFEHSPVKRVGFSRKWVDVQTEGGGVRADRVIVATGTPDTLFSALRRHFWFHSTYMALTEPIAARVRQQLGRRAVVIRDLATPPHVVRWVDDDRLLVSGADGDELPERQRDKVIVQRTGQLMYELSTIYPDISGIAPAYGWSAPYARTADGLPFIGPHRNYPRHLFAFGDSSRAVTGAYLASRVLVRQALDAADDADEAFGFNRYGHVR
jgi:glycine/D-amino acid oxidase-like deaminating enzyme